MIPFYSKLQQFINSLDITGISEDRKELLQQIALYLQKKKDSPGGLRISFICTHNSRRSQLCQVWSQTAAKYYGQEDFKAASGGTEATAFHPNAVQALIDSGFKVQKDPETENPKYSIRFSEDAEVISCFSKVYTEAWGDTSPYAAVLNCSEAEAECPFIPEAEARFALKYNDPKSADGTALEKETYAQRNQQIATEMFYLFSQIS